MRRLLLPALMISLMLSGCGGTNAAMRRVEEQRELFAGAEEMTFTADITADAGDELFSCTLHCTAEPDLTHVELLAPESLIGVRAEIKDGEATLEYGEISLGIGPAGLDSVTPVSAVPLMVSALRDGFLQRCWTEQDGGRKLIAAEEYAEEKTALTIWYDSETMQTVHCEFSQDGKTVLRCEVRDFTMR